MELLSCKWPVHACRAHPLGGAPLHARAICRRARLAMTRLANAKEAVQLRPGLGQPTVARLALPEEVLEVQGRSAILKAEAAKPWQPRRQISLFE